MTRSFRGMVMETNQKIFGGTNDTRSDARLEDAIRDLIGYELIEDRKGKGQYFQVTSKGFEIADLLRDS